MKVAFIITRDPEYRVCAEVIEAALARGWDVECWHDYSQARNGLKGYQFPSVDAVPVFRNGRPLIRTYQGLNELRGWLTDLRTDIAIGGRPHHFGLPMPAPRPFCVLLQYTIDSFCWFGPDNLLSWDLHAAYARWWVDWSANLFELDGLVIDTDAYLRKAMAHSAFVGIPEIDTAARIDPDEERRRWGIPRDQPVVVLFPFPQGVGRNTFWPQRICAEPSRLKQLANIAAYRRLEYWPDVRHGWNDRAVVTALRRFCDRNGAYLLVKSRQKTPVPSYTAAVADRCMYDDSFYPATVLEALSIASLSVSYYSNSVFESVALGVPHLCVTYAAADYNGEHTNYFSTFYTPAEGSAFQFKGVSTAWNIRETLDGLPGKTLGDFAMDSDARARYVEKFLTHDSLDGGVRTIDAIEKALGCADGNTAGASG